MTFPANLRTAGIRGGLGFEGSVSALGFPWESKSAAGVAPWRCMAYGNGIISALASSGSVGMWSDDDGDTWTANLAPATRSWLEMEHNGSYFVACGTGSGDDFGKSLDGKTWTSHNGPDATSAWQALTPTLAGSWIAVRSSGAQRVGRSLDGESWAVHTGLLQPWDSAAVHPTTGRIVVAGAGLGAVNIMFSDDDGLNWAYASGSNDGDIEAVTHDGVQFVCVGSAGFVQTSLDGDIWAVQTAAEPNDYWRVKGYAGLLVAVAVNGTNRVMTSANGGRLWTPRAAAEQNFWTALVRGAARFVALSNDGTNRVMVAA